MGMELRPYCLAQEWSRSGDHVTVLLGDYSHLRRENPAVQTDCQRWKENSVAFCAVKTPRYQGNGPRRALNVLSFERGLRRYAALLADGLRPDVV
ncbi:MAG: glycosyltransferase WbuB, partial [Oscillospiraceae bacterium]